MIREQTTTVLPNLVEINLGPVLRRLESEEPVLDGKPVDLVLAGRVYRQFLTLRRDYPNLTLIPSELIDMVWHCHILETRQYAADCQRLFGEFLHHDAHTPTESDGSPIDMHAAWEQTLAIWEREFGEAMIGESYRCRATRCPSPPRK